MRCHSEPDPRLPSKHRAVLYMVIRVNRGAREKPDGKGRESIDTMTDEQPSATGPGGRSYLGAGSRITGELVFPGSVELPGWVKGRVDAAAIIIQTSGEVDGELDAASIVIEGRFDGILVGGKVSLLASARVTGDITYESLSIESGADIAGRLKVRPYAKKV